MQDQPEFIVTNDKTKSKTKQIKPYDSQSLSKMYLKMTKTDKALMFNVYHTNEKEKIEIKIRVNQI